MSLSTCTLGQLRMLTWPNLIHQTSAGLSSSSALGAQPANASAANNPPYNYRITPWKNEDLLEIRYISHRSDIMSIQVKTSTPCFTNWQSSYSDINTSTVVAPAVWRSTNPEHTRSIWLLMPRPRLPWYEQPWYEQQIFRIRLSLGVLGSCKGVDGGGMGWYSASTIH